MMENIAKDLYGCALFKDVALPALQEMLQCLQAREQSYAKGSYILLAGDTPRHVGVVLHGSVLVTRDAADGRQSLVVQLGKSDLFGEVFACAGVAHSPVTVTAAVPCRILLLDYRRVITSCTAACAHHTQLVENMLGLLARKSLALNAKVEVLSCHTIRQRLECFFALYGQGARSFSIPYNREQLAAYLCVDRSALSAELGKMRGAGLLRFHKNYFELL